MFFICLGTHHSAVDSVNTVYILISDAKSGHYPGAVSIPFAANLLDKEKGTFKSPEDLKKCTLFAVLLCQLLPFIDIETCYANL